MSQATHDALSPDGIFQALSAYWVSGALTAGIRLGLFGALAGKSLNAAALGEAIGAPARAVAMLSDALCATGFLQKDGEGRYANAPAADLFLDPAKPSYVGGIAHIFGSPMLWTEFGRLDEVVRGGGSLMEANALTPDHPFWGVFAQHTFAIAIPNAQALAKALPGLGIPNPKRVLDIACGTGGYGYTLAQAFPEAHITFADWPKVLEQTARNGSAFGVADRCAFAPGDIFGTDYGAGYDLVVMANIHHHFDPETNLRLNRRMRDFLAPGGTVAVVDFIPDDGRRQDPMGLLFSLVMLAWTPKGNTLTEADYRRSLEAAGFSHFNLLPTPTPQKLLFAR